MDKSIQNTSITFLFIAKRAIDIVKEGNDRENGHG